MGKNRDGKFIPPKGKPSGAAKDEGLGLRKTLDNYDDAQDEQITEKYTEDVDELADNVHVMHPNRNTEKGHDYKQERQNDESAKSVNDTYDKEHGPNIQPEEITGEINKTIFAELASVKEDICISIYIPTHKAGIAVNEGEDVIRFKNQLQAIKQQLKDKGTDETEIQPLLQTGYDLLKDDTFWQQMDKGLAVFITKNSFRYLKLPMEVAEENYCNNAFFLQPLLPAMSNRDKFYLLVISKKRAKFFKADNRGMEEMQVEGLPNGIEDVVREDRDDHNTFRMGGKGGNGGANFHGIGAGGQDNKNQIAQYFDEVDETLMKEVLATENAPLMLAAVDYLVPIYKQVAEYKHVADEAITGNYDFEDTNRLYEMAKEKMEPYFNQHTEKALENYYNQSATNLTSTNEYEIISGAYFARVQHLFVARNQRIWGTFNQQDNKVMIHSSRQENDENLLDKAVTKTILNGGEVFVLEQEKMPEQKAMAAFFRY